MRSDVARFDLVVPVTLADALRLIDESGGAYKPLAGGTDVMVLLASGKLSHARFVDLWGLPELRGIEVSADAVTFGALTTYTDVQRHHVLAREYPMLAQAGSETGGVAIQNRGTIGGNIANASPAADSPPALLAYGAEVELESVRGRRRVDYAAFHTGYKTTVMAANEVITRVRMPRARQDRIHFYRKVGPRRAQAISKVCFAACAELGAANAVPVLGSHGATVRDVKIALGGVAPIVVRAHEVERTLLERGIGPAAGSSARNALARCIAPIDDVRSTARYRQRVAENLLDDLLRRLRANVGLAP
jgi:CO/xanthine dehydrogenase FAD-binding subunit